MSCEVTPGSPVDKEIEKARAEGRIVQIPADADISDLINQMIAEYEKETGESYETSN
jgi:ABC-type proline/glycine betaine transport system substrate-binding protein